MMMLPTAPGTAVKSNSLATIDYSNISEGYITASYHGDTEKRCKLQISCGGQLQRFDVPGGGASRVFPLCYGNGSYKVTVYQQVKDTSYTTALSLTADVALRDELVPFLYPTTYCEYTASSQCVKLASELFSKTKTNAEFIAAAARWIVDNIEYDKELAERVQSEKWWLPNPDEVMAAKKSICFGYASLYAALLRSQGIPCKVVVGYVGGSIFHAWNEVYTLAGGDVYGIAIAANRWARLDLTFLDTGYLSKKVIKFIANDKNYTVEYCG